jgi:hypothetical protein
MNFQNLASLNFPAEKLTAIATHMSALEALLSDLKPLPAELKKQLRTMGPGTEAFCRQALSVMEQNPQIVPPNVPLVEALADLRAIDQLRPLLQRLTRLFEKAADTHFALGSDVLAVALQGYKQLRVNGKGESLKQLRRDLSGLLKIGRRVVKEKQPLPPSTTG